MSIETVLILGGTHAGSATVVGVSDTTPVSKGEGDPGSSRATDHRVHGHE